MTVPASIRLASAGDAGDAAALLELRRRWLAERDGASPDPGFADRFRGWLQAEASRRTLWLAELSGDQPRPVGMTNLVAFERMPVPGGDPGRWGYLGNLYVDAAHRGAGIGSALVAAVLDHADDAGFERVVLSPSQRSIPLYRRAGFGPADSLMLRPRRP